MLKQDSKLGQKPEGGGFVAKIGDMLGVTQAMAEQIVKPDSELGTFGKLAKKALRKMCDGYSTDPGAFIIPGGPPRAEYDEACKPYYDEMGYTPPSISQPTTGGQCVDVGYRLEWSFLGETAQYTTSISVRGPIRVFLETGPLINGKRFYNWLLEQRTFDGGTAVSSLGAEEATQPPELNTSLTRLDNQPDLCGNQPPVTNPGTAPTYNFNTEVNIEVDGRTYPTTINSPVTNNVDKSLTIPVIITGGVNLDFGIPGGSVSDSGPAPSAKPPVFSGPEIPRAESESNNGEFPDPPTGKAYVGAYIELLDMVTPQSGIVGPLPNIVWPFVVANATLLYATSGISRILDGYRPVREDAFTLVRPSEGVEVIGCKVALSYPGSYRITPLLIDVESEDA